MALAIPTMPPVRRGGEFFLALAVFAVVVQVPGNVILSIALPPIALLVNGWHVGARRGEWSVWLWLTLTMIPALVAMVRWDLLLERPYFIQVLAVSLAAMVVMRGATGDTAARALMQGLYAGFATLALIGVVEVLTGNKLLFLRYPDSVVASWAAADRFITTAMYPNYNDFSVGLAILSIILVARFLMKPGKLSVQVCRLAAVAVLTAWVFHMGSRGALLGLLAGVAVLAVLTERKRDTNALAPWFLTTVACVVILAAAVLAQSSFVHDGDTEERGKILVRLWNLAELDPLRFLVGFGSSDIVYEASSRYLGGALVNPHNILAESVLWAGVFGLVGLVIVWLYVVRRAIANDTGRTWYAMAAVSATLVMPLLGVTPSVILSYLFPQLLLLASVSTFDGGSPEALALSSSVEDDHRQDPHDDGGRQSDDQAGHLARDRVGEIK